MSGKGFLAPGKREFPLTPAFYCALHVHRGMVKKKNWLVLPLKVGIDNTSNLNNVGELFLQKKVTFVGGENEIEKFS